MNTKQPSKRAPYIVTALANCKSMTHFSKKGLVLKISAVDSFSNPEVLGVIDKLL